jgi:hypothetical protein
MKGKILLIFALLITLYSYSQDFKIEKIKTLNNGDYKITRLLVVSDSAGNTEINKFIIEFISELKTEFEKNNLQAAFIRRGASNPTQRDSIMKSLNPNGIMKFVPSDYFIKYRGLSEKHGLYFNLGLSFRLSGESKYTSLFTAKIGVMTDSFGNAGIPAARELFNRMVKAGFLPTEVVQIGK